MEAVTGIYNVTLEKEAVDMCAGPNCGMISYDIYCWKSLVHPWNRTLL